ncbi:unnamed protein product, partial [Iphiclides podalirius]
MNHGAVARTIGPRIIHIPNAPRTDGDDLRRAPALRTGISVTGFCSEESRPPKTNISRDGNGNVAGAERLRGRRYGRDEGGIEGRAGQGRGGGQPLMRRAVRCPHALALCLGLPNAKGGTELLSSGHPKKSAFNEILDNYLRTASKNIISDDSGAPSGYCSLERCGTSFLLSFVGRHMERMSVEYDVTPILATRLALSEPAGYRDHTEKRYSFIQAS